MRNLKLLESVKIQGNGQLANCCFIAVDYDTKYVYAATDKGIYSLDPRSNKVCLCT